MQTAIADQKPPVNPCKYYLPYLKELGDVGYGHILFQYHPVHSRNEKPQEFLVEVLRSFDTEPYTAYAVRIYGEPASNLYGYVPVPPAPALPLPHKPNAAWTFIDRASLQQALVEVRNQLEIILPWLDDPTSSQQVQVDLNEYAVILRAVVNQTWNAKQALTALEKLAPPHLERVSATPEQTAALHKVELIIRGMAVSHKPIDQVVDPELVPYLLQCLEQEQMFDLEYYHEIHHRYYAQLYSYDKQ